MASCPASTWPDSFPPERNGGADEPRTPMKKMRGSMRPRPDQMASGSPGSNGAGPKPSPPRASEKQEVQSWALIPYKPPPFPAGFFPAAVPVSTSFLPKPNAVRDCPPGLRIRGGRPLAERKPPKPVVKRRLDQVRPDVVTLSDSESEGQKRARHGAPSRSGKKCNIHLPVVKKAKVVPSFEPSAPELSSSDPRARVKFVLQQFDNLRRQFVAGEDFSNRADFRASKIVMENGGRVNGSESIYGDVPGVEVGDHYYYRMELLIISLHRQSQGGIDFIPAKKSVFARNGQPVSVAVSVIASGGYEDDVDEGDTLIYTGQGGNNYKSDKRQGLDQELVRGNLALKNNCDLGLSVRLVRGCDLKRASVNQSPSGKIYYYDGLYDVKDCFQETGSAGFKVWKFKLVRKPGQAPLLSSLVMFKGKSLPPALKERGERVISEDLSNGLEPFKVRVVGCLDEDIVPTGFQYITSLRYTTGLPRPSLPKSCTCKGECATKCDCSCLALSGGQAYNDDGALLRAKRLVYECGPNCQCRYDSKCTNRVSQKGIRNELEVFKTQGKGWGVRCSNFILQGSFVCEYIGEIIHETDAEKRVSNDEYMFDLKIPDSMERRFGDVSGLVQRSGASNSNSTDDEDDANAEKYTVDANRFGNLARFINHSCEPNLFVQCVLHDHHDHRFPHIMLFASEHISPYKELTYDYGYDMDNIKVNGKIKVKNCYCGARKCQGRLY